MRKNNGVKNNDTNDDRKDRHNQLPNNAGVDKKRNGKKKSQAHNPDREWRMWGDI